MWSLLLYCTAFSSLIAYICLTIGLYKAYKAQEREIAQYKAEIKVLQTELKAVNKKNQSLMWICGNKAAKEKLEQMKKQEQEPAFLSADDPLDALLKQVGKVNRR